MSSFNYRFLLFWLFLIQYFLNSLYHLEHYQLWANFCFPLKMMLCVCCHFLPVKFFNSFRLRNFFTGYKKSDNIGRFLIVLFKPYFRFLKYFRIFILIFYYHIIHVFPVTCSLCYSHIFLLIFWWFCIAWNGKIYFSWNQTGYNVLRVMSWFPIFCWQLGMWLQFMHLAVFYNLRTTRRKCWFFYIAVH